GRRGGRGRGRGPPVDLEEEGFDGACLVLGVPSGRCEGVSSLTHSHFPCANSSFWLHRPCGRLPSCSRPSFLRLPWHRRTVSAGRRPGSWFVPTARSTSRRLVPARWTCRGCTCRWPPPASSMRARRAPT